MEDLEDLLEILQYWQMGGVLSHQIAQIIGIFAAVAAVICLLQCFFGYKLMRVWFAVTGFGIGMTVGGLFSALLDIDEGGLALFLCLIFGVAGAFLLFRLYKAGVFLTAFSLIAWAVITFIGFNHIAAGVFLGLLLGNRRRYLAVKFVRPVVILCTGISGGFVAGNAILLVFEAHRQFPGILLGLVLAVLGVLYQWKSTGGGKMGDAFKSRPAGPGGQQGLYIEPQPPQSGGSGAQTGEESALHAGPQDTDNAEAAGVAPPTGQKGGSQFARSKGFRILLSVLAPAVLALIGCILPSWLSNILELVVLAYSAWLAVYFSPAAGLLSILAAQALEMLYVRLSIGWAYGFIFIRYNQFSFLLAGLLFVLLVYVAYRRNGGQKQKYIFFGVAAGIYLLLPVVFNWGLFYHLFEVTYSVILWRLVHVAAALAFTEYGWPLLVKKLPERFLKNLDLFWQDGELDLGFGKNSAGDWHRPGQESADKGEAAPSASDGPRTYQPPQPGQESARAEDAAAGQQEEKGQGQDGPGE